MDIYFLEEYARLYEATENGKVKKFIHKNELGSIEHIFIKRIISTRIGGKNYYDIVTPYGYGGPTLKVNETLINNENSIEKAKKKLIDEFTKSFETYCIKNNIVSEFIRFHPMFKNHIGFEQFYNAKLIRNTALTKFNKHNNFQEIFSKSARKVTRRALRDNLKYEVITRVSESDKMDFIKIYYDTMDRSQAGKYYYFEEAYFEQLYKDLEDYVVQINVKLENNIIASAIYFVYGDVMHAHLSGTLEKYLNYSPAYVIKYAAFEYAEKNSIKYLHHGGGITNSENDSLLEFKMKFSNEKLSYFTGKKIYNKEIYEALVKEKFIRKESDFFPLYRLKD